MRRLEVYLDTNALRRMRAIAVRLTIESVIEDLKADGPSQARRADVGSQRIVARQTGAHLWERFAFGLSDVEHRDGSESRHDTDCLLGLADRVVSGNTSGDRRQDPDSLLAATDLTAQTSPRMEARNA